MLIFTPVVAPLTPTSDNVVKDTVGERSSSNLNNDWEDVVPPTDSAERDVVAGANSGVVDDRTDATLSSSTDTLSPAPKRVRITRSMAQDV